MTTPQPPATTAQQLILDLISQGYTQRQIAQQLNRSEDLVYVVKTGRRPGNNLIAALTDIANNRPPQPIPRRTNAAGQTVRVRAPGGRTITPEQPTTHRSRSTDRPDTRRTPLQPGRNRYRHHETIMPGGREAHLIQFPRTNQTTRNNITDLMRGIIARAASRGGRWQATITFEVDRNGQRERVQVPIGEKGGYDAHAVLLEVDSRGDALGWVEDQAGDRYGVATGGGVMVSIDMSVW